MKEERDLSGSICSIAHTALNKGWKMLCSVGVNLRFLNHRRVAVTQGDTTDFLLKAGDWCSYAHNGTRIAENRAAFHRVHVEELMQRYALSGICLLLCR